MSLVENVQARESAPDHDEEEKSRRTTTPRQSRRKSKWSRRLRKLRQQAESPLRKISSEEETISVQEHETAANMVQDEESSNEADTDVTPRAGHLTFPKSPSEVPITRVTVGSPSPSRSASTEDLRELDQLVTPLRSNNSSRNTTAVVSPDRIEDVVRQAPTPPPNRKKKRPKNQDDDDDDYTEFLHGLEEAGEQQRTPEQEQAFARWIRGLGDTIQQQESTARKLFPPSDDKKVAFNEDLSVRLFSRSKEELIELRKKTIRALKPGKKDGDDDDDRWSLLGFIDESLETVSGLFQQKDLQGIRQELQGIPEKFLQPIMCACEAPEAAAATTDQQAAAARGHCNVGEHVDLLSLLDSSDTAEEEDSENSIAASSIAASSDVTPSDVTPRETASDPGLAALWFAVPYKEGRQEVQDALDFITRSPSTTSNSTGSASIERKDSLQSYLTVLSDENSKAKSNASSSSSISVDRKKQVVRAAKRWAARMEQEASSNKEQEKNEGGTNKLNWLASLEMEPETIVEESPSQLESSTDKSEPGPDLDESNDWKSSQSRATAESHTCSRTTLTNQTESPGHSGENGPDLDESNEWLSSQIPAATTVKQSSSPPSSFVDTPLDGPDLDESNEWLSSQIRAETPRKIRAEPKPSAPDLDESNEWLSSQIKHESVKTAPTDPSSSSPDLDESNEWLASQIKAEPSPKREPRRSSLEEEKSWVAFAESSSIHQDAPSLDEEKAWADFPPSKRDTARKNSASPFPDEASCTSDGTLKWPSFITDISDTSKPLSSRSLDSHSSRPLPTRSRSLEATRQLSLRSLETSKFGSSRALTKSSSLRTLLPPREADDHGSQSVDPSKPLWKRRVSSQPFRPPPQDPAATRAIFTFKPPETPNVKDLVNAFERKEPMISPITVSPSIEPTSWADTSHEFPEDHPDLQQPILGKNGENDNTTSNGSPVSVLLK